LASVIEEAALVTAHPVSFVLGHAVTVLDGPSEPEPAGEQIFPLEVEHCHSADWIVAVPLPE
jgi:hypothetical protein